MRRLSRQMLYTMRCTYTREALPVSRTDSNATIIIKMAFRSAPAAKVSLLPPFRRIGYLVSFEARPAHSILRCR